jgi:hypothetical protein
MHQRFNPKILASAFQLLDLVENITYEVTCL